MRTKSPGFPIRRVLKLKQSPVGRDDITWQQTVVFKYLSRTLLGNFLDRIIRGTLLGEAGRRIDDRQAHGDHDNETLPHAPNIAAAANFQVSGLPSSLAPSARRSQSLLPIFGVSAKSDAGQDSRAQSPRRISSFGAAVRSARRSRPAGARGAASRNQDAKTTGEYRF